MIDKHWDAVGADYVLTETGGWSHDRRRRHAPRHRQRRREGPRLAPPARPRHAGARLDALRRPTTPSITAAEIVRRLVAFRPHPNLDDLWQGRIASMDLPDDLRAALVRPGHASTTPSPPLPPGLRPGRPRLHAHDDLAERHPRRPEDEHDPRRHRHRRRHAHGPGRHQGGRRRLPGRGARRARRRGSRSPRSRSSSRPARRSATRCGTRCARHTQVAYPGADLVPGHHHRRHRRPLLPRQGGDRLRRRARSRRT